MRAIYAFSGDPITFGHYDIVRRSSKTYDEVVVAIGENPEKKGNYLFTLKERLRLAERCLQAFENVTCVTFHGLLGEYAYRNGFDVIVRGVRNNSDLEGELVQFAVNETLHPSVDTVFFPTHRQLSHVSSGVVKAIVAEGGDVSKYCPLPIKEALEKKILGKFTIGIAGGIASGKTYVAKRLVNDLKAKLVASYVSLDAIGHYILRDSQSLIYQNTRKRIAGRFGQEVMRPNGAIDRKTLGKIVFRSPTALSELNEIMHEPMMARFYEETRELPGGVIVVEGAILVEAKWTSLVNNNVLLVDAPEKLRLRRLTERSGIQIDEASTKIRRQVSADERKSLIQNRIKKHAWGRLWELRNDGLTLDINSIVDDIVKLAK